MNSRPVLVSDELDATTEVAKNRSKMMQRFASDLSVLLQCPVDLMFVHRISELLAQKALTAEQKKSILAEDEQKYSNALHNFERPGKLHIKLGWPIEEITKMVNKEKHVEALVIGTRALKGLERFFLGSVAEEVVRNVKRPVFILGPHVQSNDYRLKDQKVKHFVVATDLTKKCRAVETYAVSMAKKVGAKVTFYYNLADSLETAAKFGYGSGEMLPSLDTVLEDIKKESLLELEQKVKRVRSKGVDCDSFIELKNADVSESLTQLSQDKALVFMGHGRQGFIASTIIGSNVRSLVMKSQVPVVVVRS